LCISSLDNEQRVGRPNGDTDDTADRSCLVSNVFHKQVLKPDWPSTLFEKPI